MNKAISLLFPCLSKSFIYHMYMSCFVVTCKAQKCHFTCHWGKDLLCLDHMKASFGLIRQVLTEIRNKEGEDAGARVEVQNQDNETSSNV